MLCVLIVEGMSVVVNVMLSLMRPPPALCNLSVRTAVKLCILGVLALGVSWVSCMCGMNTVLNILIRNESPTHTYSIQQNASTHTQQENNKYNQKYYELSDTQSGPASGNWRP